MYTDHEVELLYLGRLFDSSKNNGNGSNGNGKKKAGGPPARAEASEFTNEQVEMLVLGLPISS
jgi:hypothetical protein